MNNRLFRIRQLLLTSFIVLCCFIIFSFTVFAQDFNKYHTYNELTKILQNMVNKHKNIAKLVSTGKTLEGRDIWVVEIANRKGVPVEKRPAIFVGGNFEGDHLIGSEIALYITNHLLNNYSTNSEIKERIDKYVFYIAPRINPDAAEMMFGDVKSDYKTNIKPYDGDNDGRIDEDGPEDLNRDGHITVMRVKSPDGKYIIDPIEPRLMKEADPKKGEGGNYKLYWEGIDNDKDGFINEDPKGGVDINRNFQHEYPYYKPDAGRHMVSERESRAVMDWIIAHRNVAVVLTFGESDNLITAPNSKGKLGAARIIDLYKFANTSNEGVDKVGIFSTRNLSRRSRDSDGQQPSSRRRPSRKPETTVNKEDVEYFRIVSERYNKLTGIKNAPIVRKPEGAFFQYGYYQFGVLSFSTPGWGIDDPEKRSNKGGKQSDKLQTIAVDSLMLKWLDSEGIDGFVNWAEYDHPEFGKVEIGGFKPNILVNPPASKITDLGESHSKFVLYLSSLFPEIKIAKTEVVNHGGGVFRIKAEIENKGFLPTALRHGVVSRSVKPTMVQIGVDPKTIISGNRKTSFFQSLAGSGKRQKYEWLIRGNSGDKIELKVSAQKAGIDNAIIILK